MQLPSLIQNVYAVSTTVTNPITGPLANASIGQFMAFGINVILGLGWGLTFIMLAAGFIKYITSKGETKATDAARNWLTYAALGGVGLFFLTVLKGIITKIIGANGTPGGGNEFDPFNS